MPVQLPAPALQRIFACLDAQDTVNARQVCKTWHAAADMQDQECRKSLVRMFPNAQIDPRQTYKAALAHQMICAELAAPRPIEALNELLAANEQALAAADMAQGLHDFLDGMMVLSVSAVHMVASFSRAYLWHWTRVAQEGAERGRARTARPESTRGKLRLLDHLGGTVLGAAAALTAAPITACLVGAKAGVDTLREDVTYASVRIPRGLYTYGRIKAGIDDVEGAKRDLLRTSEALLLERARRTACEAAKTVPCK